ncbi:F-box protein, partial [Frankliniella fusca]
VDGLKTFLFLFFYKNKNKNRGVTSRGVSSRKHTINSFNFSSRLIYILFLNSPIYLFLKYRGNLPRGKHSETLL